MATVDIDFIDDVSMCIRRTAALIRAMDADPRSFDALLPLAIEIMEEGEKALDSRQRQKVAPELEQIGLQ
jgi:hypothetical protein